VTSHDVTLHEEPGAQAGAGQYPDR